ncbi:alcohol acetyltransferase [Roridomyces roridus]|uniref:Alcohol acetyltransferase n=1 Tax=Roridomyces roridus TaxID=1738132 RepID=A0AAD7C709_9AGAR|nr:alcohol acetyltransferase [Roridomyces roridus]
MSGQKLRQLGELEKLNATKNFLGMDTCIALSARYSHAPNTPLTKKILFPALRTLIASHPMLGVRFDGKLDSADIAFFRLPSVDLSRVVEFSQETNLQAALEKWFNRRFQDSEEDMPLWRVEVLADNTLIFAMHHAMGDGIALVAFHRSLLRALQQQAASDFSSVVAVPAQPIPPPVEVAMDVRPSLWKRLGSLYDTYIPGYWKQSTYAWTGNPNPTSIALHTHVRLLRFAPSDMKKLTLHCRTHGATVSSVLYELGVISLSRLISNQPDAAKYKSICLAVPMSLRSAAGASDDSICYYSASVDTYPALHTEFSWASAARVTAELKGHKKDVHQGLGFLAAIAQNYTAVMRGSLGGRRSQGLRISNVGRFVVGVEGPSEWSLGECFFGQCDSVVGAAMTMNVVGDPSGALHLTIVWGDKSLDTAFVEGFIELFNESFAGLVA